MIAPIVRNILRLNAVGRTPIVFALAMCAGAAAYLSLWHEPPLWQGLSVFAASVAAFWVSRRVARIAPLFVLISAAAFGASSGFVAAQTANWRVGHDVLSAPVGPVMVEGWIEQIEPGQRGVRLRLNVHAVSDYPGGERLGHVRLTHRSRLAMEPGRFVRCWSVLRPPPASVLRGDYAFDRQAYFEGLGAVGYVQGRCRGGALGEPKGIWANAQLWLGKQKRRLALYVQDAAGDRAGGFAAALASGDRSFMAQSDIDALRGSGLAHILAISGLHMGIFGGLVYLIVWRGLALIEPLALRVAVQKPAALAALVASLGYLIISGASVSTQRAFIMSAVFFGAILLDRAALSLRSLAVAMIIVVGLAPWSVLSPGFQMSFAATGALIATYELWDKRRRSRGITGRSGVLFWVQSLFVTSLVSSLATMPFALYHFDRVASGGLVANLAAMPIILLVSAPSAAASLFAAPFGLGELPLRIFGGSLEGVLIIANATHGLVPSISTHAHAMPDLALVYASLGLIGGIAIQPFRWRAITFFAGCSLAVGVWTMTPSTLLHWAPSGDVFLSDGSTVSRVSLLKGGGLAPLRYVDVPVSDRCKETVCWHMFGQRRIALVAPGVSVTCIEMRPADLVLLAEPDETLQPCSGKITPWSQVAVANGKSWRLDRAGKLETIAKPPCNGRPWQACPRVQP